jgi:peptidase A4-like protein
MGQHEGAWASVDDGGAYQWHAPPEDGSGRGWLRSHPGVLAYGVVALVTCVVLSTVAIAVTGTTAPKGAVPPNQAGYLWCCNVRDVSAAWDVPVLVHPAREGAEAVWIGAQTQDGTFFLQVGTNEYVSQQSSLYQAFWSDGPLDGAPQNLGDLAPGDEVSATLAESHKGWVVAFTDATKGWTHTRRIPYDASAANALAEWIEEDPVAVDPHGSKLFRMAVTHGTQVSDLLVNDEPPAPGATQPESFVDASGTRFSPTALLHDAFVFRPW